jgi:hypothetical protein
MYTKYESFKISRCKRILQSIIEGEFYSPLPPKKTPWPDSPSELYGPSDRHLSAKLVPTFCGYKVPRGQRDRSLRL